MMPSRILRLLRMERLPSDDPWRVFDTQADAWGLPRQWIVCPHCGQQSWRIPPHVFEPCPLVTQTAESLGMRFEAERSTALRGGVHIEELTRLMREHFGEEDE